MMAHRKNGLLHDQTAGRTGNEHTSLRADFTKTTRSLARNPSASDHGRRLVSGVFDLEALRGMAADIHVSKRRPAPGARVESLNLGMRQVLRAALAAQHQQTTVHRNSAAAGTDATSRGYA